MVTGGTRSVVQSLRRMKKRRCARTVRAKATSSPFLAARSMSLPGAAGSIRYSVYDNVATASTLPSPWNYTSIGDAVNNTPTISSGSLGGRWAEPKIQFLRRQGINVDFAKWRGGLLVEGGALPFVEEFIDYSYTLNRNPMQLLCCELPLLIRLDYSMTACFISAQTDLLVRAESSLSKNWQLRGDARYIGDVKRPNEL